MLKLFLLPADNDTNADNHEIVLRSMGELVDDAEIIKDRNVDEKSVLCEYEWWGYLFTDEFVPHELKVALPSFFASKYDIIVVMRRHANGIVSKAPRFFRKGVKIKEGTMIPDNRFKYNPVTCLDGFIESYV